MSAPQRTIEMSAHRKKKPNQRNERHGAGWGGGPFPLLALILATNQSFAQRIRAIQDGGDASVSQRISPDLAQMLRGNSGQALRVIVQYKNAPNSKQIARAQFRGARLN